MAEQAAPEPDRDPEWTVYRHYSGTRWYGELATLRAQDSERAIARLRAMILEKQGRWRAFRQGEMLLLKSRQAEVIHVVQVRVDVTLSRVREVPSDV